MPAEDSSPPDHADAHEHVHVSLALFDQRRAIERATEVMRAIGLIGTVVPAYSEGERLGAVEAAIATKGDVALVTNGEHVEDGPSLRALADRLRARLASGVLVHDDAGSTLAATVPANVGERMEAATKEPFAYPSVAVPADTIGADEIDELAFAMGGPTTLLQVAGRSIAVASTLRPSIVPVELRPMVRLFVRDRSVEVMLWSKHAVRGLQNPMRRLRAQAQADVLLHWEGPPILLVGDTDAPSPAALRIEQDMWSRQDPVVSDAVRQGIAHVARELGLDADSVERLARLAGSPWTPTKLREAATVLGIDESIVAVAERPDDVARLPGAVSATPTGMQETMMQRAARRRR